MVLVGPSGCGKTTLLRMVAGLADPSSGQVLFDGTDITLDPPGARNVAMVFQNYALFPHMTVERNLSFGLRLRRHRSKERNARVAEVARLLRMEELLKRFPRELSGGQKQRVALGRALIRRPVAFLFDEPLSNLDPALRVEMRAEIAQLHKGFPVTTIYVTHDQVEAMTMGSRIAVMHAGRILQTGVPQSVYRDPDNLFTAGFIGSPALNVIRGVLEPPTERAAKVRFTAEAGLELLLPTESAAPALKHTGQVSLGVRPEHLVLCRPEQAGALAGKVTLVEELGREHIVYMERDGLSLRAVAPASSAALPRLGELVHATPDARQLLWFAADTEQRLR